MQRFDVLDPQTPLLGHHFLEASAGTGKTFAIEHITARLIEEHDFELDEILIVTFTRAATRELKMRIRDTLKKCPPSLAIQKALTFIDQGEIYTIHGFCHRMLTEYAYEAGLGYALLSEKESDYRAILKEHILDFFRTALDPDTFSTAQVRGLLRSVRNNKETLLTKVLNLVEKEGEFPIYTSFKKAHETYNTLRSTTPFDPETVLEFNKVKDKTGVLKEPYQTQANLLEKSFLTLEEFESLTKHPPFLTHIKEENRSRKATRDPKALYAFREALFPILEEVSSPLCTLIRIARSVRSSAKQALEDKEILAPNDILKKMGQALTIPAFRQKVRSRFRAAIIDEFQDTDPIQWNIFKTLFIDDPIEALYLVGDPKQSIYAFRSADIYTYLTAEKAVSTKAHLDTNYRSDPTLIQSLNTLFSQKPDWLSLPDAPLPFHPVKHALEKPNRLFPDDKEPIHYFIAEVKKFRERTWPSPEIEKTLFFPFIAQEILHLTHHDFCYSDCSILVKDRYQAARLKAYLESKNIPTNSKSTEPLTATPTFSLVRSLLEALISPTEIPVKRFLSHLHSHHDLKENETLLTETLAAFSRPQPLHAALRDLYQPTDLETYSDYLKLSELLLTHQMEAQATLPELLDFLLTLNETPRCPVSEPNSVTIMTIHMSKGLEFNIVFALGLINRYTGREDFIRHQKEWLLFAPEHAKCQAALQHQEAEKLRQLYVALTRAKHRLYIPLLKDTSETPVPLGQASPLELFNPTPTDFTLLTPQTFQAPPAPQTHLEHPLSIPQPPSPHYLHSYSSLARTSPQAPIDIPTDLPKGAETGILLHSLLETLLRHPHTHIPTLLDQKLPAHFPYQTTHDILYHALHTSLTPHSFSLSQVTRLYPEVEFLYPDGPHFIKGFIDLVFEYQNTYYLLDWKTNLLPAYDPRALHEAMTHHDYYLQARLYHTALSRHLGPIPIAGTYYIFLRGLPSAGILFLPNN